MLKTKKTMRFLTVFALIFAMVFSIMTVPVSAAGVEDWYGHKATESLTMYGTNLTPSKTLRVSGVLVIEAQLTVIDSLTFPDQVTYVVEIRGSDGAVLAQKSTLSPVGLSTLRVEAHVPSGPVVRIYTSAHCTAHGAKLNAKVQYTHEVI